MNKCVSKKISEMNDVHCILPEDMIPVVHKGENRKIYIGQLIEQLLLLIGDPDVSCLLQEIKELAMKAEADATLALQNACSAYSKAQEAYDLYANIDTRVDNLEQDVYVLKKLANTVATLQREVRYLSEEVEALKNSKLEMRVVPSDEEGVTNYGLYKDNEILEGIIRVPTDTSKLTNGAGFITEDALPTKTSQLTNDSGFLIADNLKGITFTSGSFTAVNYTPVSATTASVKIPTKLSQLTQDISLGATNLGGLSDVTINSVAAGDILYYDGNKWVNTNLSNIITTAIQNAALWVRTESNGHGTLSPKTAGDDIDTTGAIYSGTNN